MELSTLEPIEYTFEILHPKTAEPIGVSVTIMSADDGRMSKIKRSIADRQKFLQARGKTFKETEIEENLANILYSAITGWNWYGDVSFNDEKPELNRSNVFAIFSKLPWFRDQIKDALNTPENFY